MIEVRFCMNNRVSDEERILVYQALHGFRCWYFNFYRLICDRTLVSYIYIFKSSSRSIVKVEDMACNSALINDNLSNNSV